MKNILILIILSMTFLTAQRSESSKSKLLSLVFPGWGQHVIGESKRAKSFFIGEAALWLLYIGGKNAADWYESDYLAFAELHSNVDMLGKNYLFYVNLGHYDSFEKFNDTKSRKRDIENKYEEGKGLEWEWDNLNNRIQYDEMRIKSAIYDKYAKFAVSGLILNRLVSLIDVIYLERSNMKLETQFYNNPQNFQFDLILKF